ncbi:UNVERIFIED_CONTAM: hypothetical protein Sradi_0364400 [Sesamum radiatum]|uniref:Uncharacterized protein n=1 Tax=Sesamum radiatum TaxID=300843 RepID=A0AAW2W5N8_SESRA
MANPTSFSNFTPLTFLYLLLLSFRPLPISSLNITDLLSSYPDLSDFTHLSSPPPPSPPISPPAPPLPS